MPISFEMPESVKNQSQLTQMVAEQVMRSSARYYDEHEHERPTTFIEFIWPFMKGMEAANLKQSLKRAQKEDTPASKGDAKKQSSFQVGMIHLIENLSWGDAGIYLCIPGSALAGAAIHAVGTSQQKERFLNRFAHGGPKWGAMAMTEPQAGSDTSAIRTTAKLDPETNEWILNGEKIFVTSGSLALAESDGLVVVWATLDPKLGRAGMRPFVVEPNTPGVSITKKEHKLGIRASDTVSIVFEDARIPYDNILGSPELKQVAQKGGKGFKGAMKTFDSSRPWVAASALGVGRAALAFTRERLADEGIAVPEAAPYHRLSAIQNDLLEMEANLKGAWLLTIRAAALMDAGESNSLEASMCKVKAGKAVTLITQKCVELLGPLGYSRELLVEKWMRDAKINDIFEGTGQINTLIVARRILGYSRRELK